MRAQSLLTLWVVVTVASGAAACTKKTFVITPRSAVVAPASHLRGAALIDLSTMTTVRRTGVKKLHSYPNPALLVIPSEPRIRLIKASVHGTTGRTEIPKAMIQQAARFELRTVTGRRYSVKIVRYLKGYHTFARMTLEISR